MSLTNPNKVITEERLSEFYQEILPYLGGTPSTFYSTTEKKIGQWIDGKPLYQKTINFGALPSSSGKSVAHGISNVDKMLKVTGIGITSTYTGMPLPYVHTSTLGNSIALRADRTNIVIETGSDRSGLTGYVTLQYTKTTD